MGTLNAWGRENGLAFVKTEASYYSERNSRRYTVIFDRGESRPSNAHVYKTSPRQVAPGAASGPSRRSTVTRRIPSMNSLRGNRKRQRVRQRALPRRRPLRESPSTLAALGSRRLPPRRPSPASTHASPPPPTHSRTTDSTPCPGMIRRARLSSIRLVPTSIWRKTRMKIRTISRLRIASPCRRDRPTRSSPEVEIGNRGFSPHIRSQIY